MTFIKGLGYQIIENDNFYYIDICAGSYSTGGYGLVVDNIEGNMENLYIYAGVVSTLKGDNMAVPTVISYPRAIIKLNKLPKNLIVKIGNTYVTEYIQLGTIEIEKINMRDEILEKPFESEFECLIYSTNKNINEIGNFVIFGDNYNNGTYFSNLKKLANGDNIEIIDSTNKKVIYKVYNIFETQLTDTSFYYRNTNGAREITLVTTTDDNSKRLVVCARENIGE